MAKVKICGLTNLEDAQKAIDLGADFLGFVFFENSPRFILPEIAKKIIDGLRGDSQKVGLFFDKDINFVEECVKFCRLDLIQLHGNEGPEYVSYLKKDFVVIKSFKLKNNFNFGSLDNYDAANFYLFDTYKEGMPGGTGISFDWNMLKGRSFAKPIFLAGGLRPDNVKKAIETVSPFAVDVASGVESFPGRKDRALMEEFINAAK